MNNLRPVLSIYRTSAWTPGYPKKDLRFRNSRAAGRDCVIGVKGPPTTTKFHIRRIFIYVIIRMGRQDVVGKLRNDSIPGQDYYSYGNTSW